MGVMMNWLRTRDRFLAQLVALVRSECRYKTFPEGEVSDALARAVACHDDPYERMLMGKRPDFT